MKRILVVEDTLAFRAPVAAALRRAGYVVDCASHGGEALQLAQSHRPDLILLDIAMPGLDGLSCLRSLRAMPRTHDVPVIMLTASSDPGAIKQAIAAGVRGYLLKSEFSLSDLLARVQAVVGQEPQAGVQAAAPVAGRHAVTPGPGAPAGATGAARAPSAPVRAVPAGALQPGGAPASPPAPVVGPPSAAPGAVQPGVSRVGADEPGGAGVASRVSGGGDASARPAPLKRLDVLERIRHEAQLKAVPAVLQQVMALTSSSQSSFDDVARAVRRDHALSIKVMKVANSSFFGTGKGVQSLAEAAQRIGMDGVKNTIATILTIEHFETASSGGLTPQRFWEHSLATGTLADIINQSVGGERAEHVFLGGLLHDVGRLMLDAQFPDHYRYVLAEAAARRVELIVVEREVFGLGHDDVTKELLLLWDTPKNIREVAVSHELSPEHIERTTHDAQSALVVALANRLAHALLLGDSGHAVLLPFAAHAKALRLNSDAIRSIAAEAVERTQEMQIFYASRADRAFREPLALELAGRADASVRVAVLATGAPGDPLSLFFDQLGWLDNRKPRIAVLDAPSPRAMDARVRELQRLEDGVGARLDVVVATPDDQQLAVDDALAVRGGRRGRRHAVIAFPGSYSGIVDAVAGLASGAAPAQATAPVGRA